MNNAIAGLTASSLCSSPLFAPPRFSSILKHSFCDCFCRNFISSYYSSSSTLSGISVHSSTFLKFLNSAIALTSTSLVRQLFSSTQSLDSQSYLTISRCCFTSCSAAIGGAVYVTSGSIVVISDSYFLSCIATTRGGGTCINQSNLSLIRTTYCKCSITSSGYGAASSLVSNSSNLIKEQSLTVYLCPSAIDSSNWHAFDDTGGIHIHENLNFSYGYFQNLAGPQHCQMTSCQATFISSSSNMGTALGFQSYYCSGEISHWNVFNNSKSYVMRVIDSSVNISYFTFYGNDVPLFSDSTGAAYLFNCVFQDSSLSAISGTLVTVSCSFGIQSPYTNSVAVNSQFYSNDCVITDSFTGVTRLSSHFVSFFTFAMMIQ